MPNPENIRPPVKGEIRNPKGKPVGTKSRKTLLRKWLELNASVLTPITGEQQIGTIEDAVNIALIKKALEGDVNAIKEINDTLYGKITEKHEVGGNLEVTTVSVKVKRPDGTGT
jgi:hypothetical protein